MVSSRVVVLLALVGCGRFGFGADAPEPDARVSAVDAGPVGPTVLVEESFDPMRQGWAVDTTPGAAPGPATGQGYDSPTALQSTVTGPGAEQLLLWPITTPVTQGTIAVRVWIRADTGLIAEHANVISIRAVDVLHNHDVNPAADSEAALVLGGKVGAGGFQAYGSSTSRGTNFDSRISSGGPKDDTWYCMELDVDISMQNDGNVRLYCNDNLISYMAGKQTIDKIGFSQVALGLFAIKPAQQNPPPRAGGSMFFDDIVIATSPTAPPPGPVKSLQPLYGCQLPERSDPCDFLDLSLRPATAD